MLAVHIEAAFDLAQQVAPSMIQRGSGKIINVGSVMSHQGGWQIPAYAIAKHGLAGLTKSLCNSWAAQGITSIASVRLSAHGTLGLIGQRSCSRPADSQPHPCRALGTTEELGGLCVFLGSSASNYMHGSIIDIDGGWLAR